METSLDNHEEVAAEVAAMQFAGGMSIARVAALWEKEAEWVEASIRQALRAAIPRRDGGTKMSRTEARAARSDEGCLDIAEQGELEFMEAPERIAA